jgi:SAM-dependent methyltransferase
VSPTPRPIRPPGALSLGRYPHVYDAAFSWDRTAEARTFLRVATELRGSRPREAVELACGSGPLARRWAEWGLDVFGVDRSLPALQRARALSGGRIPPGHWRTGDLRDFRIPRPVDLAVLPLDGLSYLVKESDLRGFFRSAQRALVPGGVLAMDLTLYPDPHAPPPIRNHWAVSLRPTGRLDVRWESRGRPWGRPARRWEIGAVDLRLPDGPRQRFWESAPHALLSAMTIRSLAESAGGFGAMVLYSDAAHHEPGTRLHRLRPDREVGGPHLLCWRRDPPGE